MGKFEPDARRVVRGICTGAQCQECVKKAKVATRGGCTVKVAEPFSPGETEVPQEQ